MQANALTDASDGQSAAGSRGRASRRLRPARLWARLLGSVGYPPRRSTGWRSWRSCIGCRREARSLSKPRYRSFAHLLVSGSVALLGVSGTAETLIELVRPIDLLLPAAVLNRQPFLARARVLEEAHLVLIQAEAFRDCHRNRSCAVPRCPRLSGGAVPPPDQVGEEPEASFGGGARRLLPAGACTGGAPQRAGTAADGEAPHRMAARYDPRDVLADPRGNGAVPAYASSATWSRSWTQHRCVRAFASIRKSTGPSRSCRFRLGGTEVALDANRHGRDWELSWMML